jgi:hypothetical protein
MKQLKSRFSKWYGTPSPPPNIVLVVIIVLPLIAFVLGTWRAYSMPETVEKELSVVSYQQAGQFDYLAYVTAGNVYGTPPETAMAQAPTSLYFTSIIDSIEISYDYEFLPDSAIDPVSSQVEIVGIVTGPSRWEKEIPLHSAENFSSQFTVGFPLDLKKLSSLVNDTEDELGFGRYRFEEEVTYDLVIEARVKVKGNTGYEPINNTFVQSMKLKKSSNTLTWDNTLFLSERESLGGFSYKHQGNFSYTINLKENSLYGSDTLTSPPFEPPALVSVAPGDVIFPNLTDIIKTNFTYKLRANRPLRNVGEEVTVTATLEYPDIWKKTVVLVPATQKTSDFKVDFSLDIKFFNDLASNIRGELSMGPPTHLLTIEAKVHTTADSDFGRIDEVFTQTLSGEMGATALVWQTGLDSSKAGAITRKQTVVNPQEFLGLSVSESRVLFPTLLGIVVALLLFIGGLYFLRRPARLPEIEREARRARRKYKGLIVDVRELPPTRDAVTVPLSSLPSLMTTAQGLLKPVLHLTETDKHTYCVIDGLIRYEYVSELEPSDPEDKGTQAE